MTLIQILDQDNKTIHKVEEDWIKYYNDYYGKTIVLIVPPQNDAYIIHSSINSLSLKPLIETARNHSH